MPCHERCSPQFTPNHQHVQVSDIKRANGLLSDTGMYAKDTLLIPTQAMAVG